MWTGIAPGLDSCPQLLNRKLGWEKTDAKTYPCLLHVVGCHFSTLLQNTVDSSLWFGFFENKLRFALPKAAASIKQSLLHVRESALKCVSVLSQAPEMLLIAAHKKASEV